MTNERTTYNSLKQKLEFHEQHEPLLEWGGFKSSYDLVLSRKKKQRLVLIIIAVATILSFSLLGVYFQNKIQSTQSLSNSNPGFSTKAQIENRADQSPIKTSPSKEKHYSDPKNKTAGEIDPNKPINYSHTSKTTTKYPIVVNQTDINQTQKTIIDIDKIAFKPIGISFPVFKVYKLFGQSLNSNIKPMDIIKNTKVALMINSGLSYTSSTFENGFLPSPTFHEDYKFLKLKSESPGLSFEAGLNLRYYLSDRVSIQSGLFYSAYSQKLNYNYSNYKIPVIDSATNNIIAYIIDSSKAAINLNHNNSYKYFQIPMILNIHHPINDRWGIYAKFGLGLNYALKSNNYLLTFDELSVRSINQSEVRPWNLNYTGGFGISYQVSNKLQLHLEPNTNGLLYSYLKSEEYTQRYNAYGLNLKFEIKL